MNENQDGSKDRDAIARLIYDYAELLDCGELEAVAALFAEGTLRSNRRPDVRRGRDQALGVYRDSVILYDGIPCTKHVITNVCIDLAAGGSSATARSYFTVLQARPELPLQPIIAGRYHDSFSRRDGVWRFADRLILVDLVGELRWHVRQSLRP